jgi:hypothetical protein
LSGPGCCALKHLPQRGQHRRLLRQRCGLRPRPGQRIHRAVKPALARRGVPAGLASAEKAVCEGVSVVAIVDSEGIASATTRARQEHPSVGSATGAARSRKG